MSGGPVKASQNDRSIGNIRNVLEQVKSGKIDKSVAYNELRDILHQAVSKRSKDVETTKQLLHEPGPENDDENVTIDDKSDSSSITRFTKEERQLIINKLIEKKRMDRKLSQPSERIPTDDTKDDQETLGDEYERNVNSSNSKPNGRYKTHHEQQYHGDETMNSVMDAQSPSGNQDWNSPEYSSNYDYHNARYSNGGNNFISTYPQDETGIGSMGRSNRILRTEAAIREEMFRECTFHPQIKPLPPTYGQPKFVGTPFYERVTKWQQQKTHQKQKKRKEFVEIETQDCSFHPTINRHSYKAMQEIRADSEETVAERLYREAKSSTESRNKFLEDEMRMQEEINKQLCTFKPNLQTKGFYEHVNPKYAHTPEKSSKKPVPVSRDIKECTFTPKIKGVRPHMSSAKLYVQENVVNRLTRPSSAVKTPNNSRQRSFDDSMVSKSYENGRIMDVASFMGQTSMSDIDNRGRSRSVDRSGGLRSHSAPRERSTGRGDGRDTGQESVASQERKIQFENFLLRQKYASDQKSRKLTEKTQHLMPNFQPEICQQSKVLSSRVANGEFLDRVERDVLSRKEKLVKYDQVNETKYSFTPKINAKSTNMRPRSSYEMSRGDLLRKETNQRMSRLKQEQEQAAELTFQPEISRRASFNAKSVLKSVTESTTQFTAWYRETQQKRQDKHEQAKIDKMNKELADCTFAPLTKECPSYIKRIAKSMEIVRASRNMNGSNRSHPDKPDWR